MKTQADIERLEKLIGQLKAFHAETSQLAKKSPNDAVNTFKLKLINATLTLAHTVLGKGYIPFGEFQSFDPDALPSNSDVTMMVAQYLEEAERYRSRHVAQYQGYYYYVLNGNRSEVRAAPPSWSKK